ncbi:hypothetical protein BH10BAC6_BH10BAC6_11020 [soil metagenome]
MFGCSLVHRWGLFMDLTLPAILGHVGYLLLIIASLVRVILPLRVLAIGSGLFAMASSLMYGTQDWPWEFVFASVNIFQTVVILRERSMARLTPEEETLRQKMFGQLSIVDFHRMIRTGSWVTVESGEEVTKQGHQVVRIVLLTDGAASVTIDTEVVAYLKQGDFIGEMAFVSGNPASATVETITTSRYLMWRFADLKALLSRHPDIQSALQSVFNRNLIDKLSRDGSQENAQQF